MIQRRRVLLVPPQQQQLQHRPQQHKHTPQVPKRKGSNLEFLPFLLWKKTVWILGNYFKYTQLIISTQHKHLNQTKKQQIYKIIQDYIFFFGSLTTCVNSLNTSVKFISHPNAIHWHIAYEWRMRYASHQDKVTENEVQLLFGGVHTTLYSHFLLNLRPVFSPRWTSAIIFIMQTKLAYMEWSVRTTVSRCGFNDI